NVFESWGTVGQYRGLGRSLGAYVEANRAVLSARLQSMLGVPMPVEAWMSEIESEVNQALAHAVDEASLLDELMGAQLLPRYGFPIDVVSLYTDYPSHALTSEPIQRDRSIALSEYAPGGEVVVDGYIHRSVGLFDPFTDGSVYSPDGWFYECRICRHVEVVRDSSISPPVTMAQCSVCLSATEPRRT